MVELHKISSTILKYVLDVNKKLKKTLIYQCFLVTYLMLDLKKAMKRKVTDTPGRFAMALCEIVFVEKSITSM